jgi:PAS domain S-box-containing protein
MKRFPLPLRFSIPVILVVFGSALSLFSLKREIHLSHQRMEEGVLIDIRFAGNQIAGILEYLYRRGDVEQAEIVLSKMGSDPKLRLALLCDENNRVLLATRYELRDRAVAETSAAKNLPIFSTVRQKMTGQILFSPDRRMLQAIYPVLLDAAPGELLPSRVGILALEYDLSSLKDEIDAEVLTRSRNEVLVLALLCTALWFFFDKTLTRRAARLVTASNRLARGKLDVRARLRGSDELAQISAAFDRMAKRIQKDTRTLQKSEERFRSLVANIPGVIYRCACDRDWTMEFISDAIADLSGYPATDFLDNRVRTFASIIHPSDRELVEQTVEQGVADQQPYIIEYRIVGSDGSIKWVYEKGQAIWHESGEMLGLDGAIFDISDRKRREETLQLIVEGTASTTGDEFFVQSVRCLAEALNVRYAVVAEFANEAKDRARTLAFWQDGKLGENFEYDLAGTPCEQVLAGQIGDYPQQVQTLFPEALGLIQMGVQSFLGIPLVTATGEIVGHLVAMDSQPMVDSQSYELILRIFAARAAAELERKYAETRLREREQFLRSIYDGVEESIFVVDVLENGEFRYVGLNPAHERLTGMLTSQLQGKTPEEVLPPEAARVVGQHYQDCVDAGETITSEECLLFQGLETWWITSLSPLRDSAGRIYRLIGTSTNITQRKQAEKERERLVAILQASTDHVGMADARGNILWNNAQAKKILGFLPDANISHLSISNYHPQWALEVIENEGLPTAMRDGIWVGETALLRGDGSEMPVSQMIIAHKSPDDRVEYFSTVMRDLSDRKCFERELQKAKENAEVANHAKSEFLARMSHELRTPLNAILGFTQLLHRDRALSDEHQQAIAIVNRSGEHLLALINDVLEMSKIEAGRIKLNETSFDLYCLLDSIEEMLCLKATTKRLTLTFERALEVPQYVTADESKLRQVLINLLGNAIKFTPQGSVILRVLIPNPKSQIPNLKFQVEDTGVGIAPDELKTLFDAFVQTELGRRSQQGTGLGLAISRKFVQLMGGDLQVTSILGRGSTFTLEIPAKIATADQVQTPLSSKRVVGLAPNPLTYRLLVVDDSWEHRQLLLKFLTPLGFQMREAENGKEGVALWQSWKPHLIFMDMGMPVMNGHEATKLIKATAQGQETVVIALTASAFEDERAVIVSEGCDDFISKPFRENEIFERLAKHLGVRYLYEEPPQIDRDSSLLHAPLTREDLATMPRAWVQQLNQAARTCCEERIFQLLEEIPAEQATLLQTLTELAYNFNYDELIELTQG